MRIREFAWVAVTALAATGVSAAQGVNDPIDFRGLGRDFMEAHCGEDALPTTCTLQAVLDASYARASLGAFDVRYPVALLGEKNRPQDFVELAVGLCDLQRVWIEWLTVGTESADAALADVAILREWVADWSPKQLVKLARDPAAIDLYEYLEAEPAVREAQERLADLLKDGERIGLPMQRQPMQLVLSPTRLDFMQWVGYAGQLEPAKQAELWNQGTDQWTQFWSGWTFITALEYGPWDGFDPKFKTGKGMKTVDKTGLVEQVSLQAGMGLIRYCVGRDLDHPDNAIVMNMVIEFVGQLNTVDGEGQLGTSGGRTRPYSRFVPGGNPSGGTLPPRSAQARNTLVKNQWRKDNGQDHFLGVLAKGQKDGGKWAVKKKEDRWRDKTAHFLLKTDNDKHVVSAPFFGPHAAEQEYPPLEFLTDYGEFYRAYKSAFFYWLRAYAGDPESTEHSVERFRDLMHGLAGVRGERTFDDLAEEVYGVPLSAADDETDSLEWRFLGFLKDQ